jgi:hypothetical protein
MIKNAREIPINWRIDVPPSRWHFLGARKHIAPPSHQYSIGEEMQIAISPVVSDEPAGASKLKRLRQKWVPTTHIFATRMRKTHFLQDACS